MDNQNTLIHRRVKMCQEGVNPYVVTKVNSGWVVLGDTQFLYGYTLLLPDPVCHSLNDLSADQRKTFLYEMSIIGDALLHLTDSIRINYEILGNSEPALHAHIFPRYSTEPVELSGIPAWFYDKKIRQQNLFDEKLHGKLKHKLCDYLEKQGIVTSNN